MLLIAKPTEEDVNHPRFLSPCIYYLSHHQLDLLPLGRQSVVRRTFDNVKDRRLKLSIFDCNVSWRDNLIRATPLHIAAPYANAILSVSQYHQAFSLRSRHYLVNQKKTGHLSQLRQMLIDFQNSFTDGPITRKHVATLLCKTLMFKNLISTLINTSCSLSATSSETGLLYLQTSEAIWLYTLRYHIIISDKFCWSLFIRELFLSWHFVCIIHCLRSESAIL